MDALSPLVKVPGFCARFCARDGGLCGYRAGRRANKTGSNNNMEIKPFREPEIEPFGEREI